MKTLQFLIIRMAAFFVGAVMILSGSARAADQSPKSYSPQAPPPIVLGKCIPVQNGVGHNPSSPVPNDVLVVAKYEEKSDETGIVKGGLKPGRALNMYLVIGVLVSPENQEKGVVHSTLLIVKVSTTDTKSSRETVRQWIFIDEDGDRKIDSAVFQETVTGKGKKPISSKEVKFPENRLQELQSYYEKAALALGDRTKEGLGEGCVIS